MKKLTKKVHYEEPNKAEVWVRQQDATTSRQKEHGNEERISSGTEECPKLPIIYSKHYGVRFGGLEKCHPFDAAKGHHIHKFLCEDLDLSAGHFYEPTEITKDQLLRVHTPNYLRSLSWSINAARISEIPALIFVPNCFVQRGYLRPMRFQAAGSIMAGKLALQTGWAINLGGGFHHCCSYKGGGFCPYADITLLIVKLFEEEPSTVRSAMIIDLDAHQGNGHERDFYNNPMVYIFDMYNESIYPRDDTAKSSIRRAVELQPHTGDRLYLAKLDRNLSLCLDEFTPDVVVYNAGTDVLQGDPLGLLAISPEGVIERDHLVFSTFRQLGIPIVMLLSGGYLKSSAKVIADSIVNLKQKGLLD